MHNVINLAKIIEEHFNNIKLSVYHLFY